MTEIVPYAPNVPDGILQLNAELHDFLEDQTRSLREQHLKMVHGQTTMPSEALDRVYDDAQFELGIKGRFNHPVHGLVRARFVRFAAMLPGGGPVGVPDTESQVNWTVTNDFGASDPFNALGIIASPNPIADGQFGWVIVEGALLRPIGLRAGETAKQGNELVWSATGELSVTLDGVTLGFYVGSADVLPAAGFVVGDILTQISSNTNRDGVFQQGLKIEGIESVAATAAATVSALSSTVAANNLAIAKRVDTVEATVDGNSATLISDRTARVAGDAILAKSVDTLNVKLGDEVAALNTVIRTAEADADTARAASIESLRAQLQSGIDGVQASTAKVDSIATTLVTRQAASATALRRVEVGFASSTANLAGATAGPRQSIFATPIFLDNITLVALDLFVGDFLSWGGFVRSATGTAVDMRVRISFRTDAEVELSFVDSLFISNATDPTLSFVENIAIPTGTVKLFMQGTFQTSGADAADMTIERVMLNRGGTLSPFVSTAALAGAQNLLEARVGVNEGVISANSIAITNVEADVTTAEGDIVTNASATTTLAARVTVNEGDVVTAFARWSVGLNVDGHISGIELNSGLDTSQFIVNVDEFRIANATTQEIPFEIVGGVVKLKELVVSQQIRSDNWSAATKAGFLLDRDTGTFQGQGIQIFDTGGNLIFGTGGGEWDAIIGAAKAADNATVGAPAGSNVAGVEAVNFFNDSQTYINFDESVFGSRMDIEHDPVWDFIVGGTNTVEFWMFATSTSGNDAVVTKNLSGAGWGFRRLAASAVLWTFDSSVVRSLTHQNTMTKDQWHHIAFSRDATGLIFLYLDGVKSDTSITTPGTMFNTKRLQFGARIDTSDPHNGGLRDVRFWTDVRTEVEINDNMFEHLKGDEANLIGLWKLDEGTGMIAENSAVSGSATTDSAAIQSTGPTWAGGVGRSLGSAGQSVNDFNDNQTFIRLQGLVNGNRLELTNSAVFDLGPTSIQTWEGWVRITNFAAGENTIISKGLGFLNSWGLWILTSGQPQLWTNDGVTTRVVNHQTLLTLNQWHHLAFTRTSGGSMRIHVDGIPSVSALTQQSGLANANVLQFGVQRDTVDELRGDMRDFRHWTTFRLNREILDNMFTEYEGTETGLNGLWRMDEGTGLVAANKGSAGTSHNAALIQTSTVWRGAVGTSTATDGAEIGVNVTGQITAANVSTFIANAAILNAQIGTLDAGKITTGLLVADRIQIDDLTLTSDGSGNLIVKADGITKDQLGTGINFKQTDVDSVNKVVSTSPNIAAESAPTTAWISDGHEVQLDGTYRLRSTGGVGTSINIIAILQRSVDGAAFTTVGLAWVDVADDTFDTEIIEAGDTGDVTLLTDNPPNGSIRYRIRVVHSAGTSNTGEIDDVTINQRVVLFK